MTENNTVASPVEEASAYVSDPNGKRNEDFIVITIGSTGKCIRRYELTKQVPNVGTVSTVEELNALTSADGIGLQQTINAAYRQIFGYRPGFALDFDKSKGPIITPDPTNADKPYKDFPLGPSGHEGLQKTLDEYTPGAVKATGGIKAKARVADSITAALAKRSAELGKDISLAELMEKIAKLK